MIEFHMKELEIEDGHKVKLPDIEEGRRAEELAGRFHRLLELLPFNEKGKFEFIFKSFHFQALQFGSTVRKLYERSVNEDKRFTESTALIEDKYMKLMGLLYEHLVNDLEGFDSMNRRNEEEIEQLREKNRMLELTLESLQHALAATGGREAGHGD